MKNKKKIILITLITLLFIITITILMLNQTGIIKRIIENNNKEEIKKEISYEVYKHVNGKTAMLVVAEDTENGIQKIIYPNNEMELYCNGKTKVAFDYNTDITGKESLTFTMVNTKNEEIEKTIAINDQFYLDMIDHNLTKETETQKALTVNYKEESATKQYKIGEGETWTDYTNTIRLDDYQILETLENGNKTPNVYLRQVDKIGNEIIVESKLNYTIPDTTIYKQEDTLIEGESILACVENNDLETGNYIFRVTGRAKEENEEGVIEEKTEIIDYPVELYNYNEEANYKASNEIVVNNIKYTGIGKTNSEKRMIILKYNKGLNINEGAIITPTGTSEEINGATHLCTKKGMLVYCAETLTNNGEITMTARGTVNQSGENVYLYKNENGTYEYIPSVGGIGGTAVSGIRSGIIGQIGVNRQTAGGGSGGAALRGLSGAGGNGTSYSGGSGGGATFRRACSQSGSSLGGAGGHSVTYRENAYDNGEFMGSGAGNPGGIFQLTGNYTDTIRPELYIGETGTGGLMIVNANTIINNGAITSNGSKGGNGHWAGGGGSGAGSINLFYKNNIIKGTVVTNGGNGRGSYPGGNGGTGCITIGNISTGTFVKDE